MKKKILQSERLIKPYLTSDVVILTLVSLGRINLEYDFFIEYNANLMRLKVNDRL